MFTLTIKKKWFDMIRDGVKKEEYREIKPYYETRFQNLFGLVIMEVDDYYEILQGEDVPEEIRREPIQEIVFRNGYSPNSPTIIAKCRIRLGEGKKEWGAEEGKRYFVLEILEVKGIKNGRRNT